MKRISLLLMVFIALGCNKTEPVPEDMTRFLVGTYRLQYVTNLGDERKYEWIVEKESENTVKVYMTRTDVPWRQGGYAGFEGFCVRRQNSQYAFAEILFAKDKDIQVEVEGTLYQGKLFVNSDYYQVDTGFASDEIPFIKQ